MLYEILMQNMKHVKALIGLQYTKIIFFATALNNPKSHDQSSYRII